MHSINVALISYRIAKTLGIKHKELIVVAALLHDIGKMRLNKKILNKKGHLTDAEYEHVKKHVEYGVEILKKLRFPDKICTIVGQHHESNDGSGYPKGIKKDAIYIESRIIKIADTFDALTTNRVYRKKVSKNEAIIILKKECSSYDPQIMNVLIKLICSDGTKVTV